MHEDINTKATNLVRNVLEEAGLEDRLLVLSETARSAEEAAKAIGVEVGAIVKTLIFTIEDTPIAALISGDRQCNMESLPRLLGKEASAKRPNANEVKAITGYSIGAVSPLGLNPNIPIFIDDALGRFQKIWAAAGHTHLVMGLSFDELARLTKGQVSADLGLG